MSSEQGTRAPAQGGTLKKYTNALWALLGFIGLAAVVVTPLELRDQALFAAGVFGLALVLNRGKGRGVTLAMALLSIAVSSRYLYWRFSTTLLQAEWSVDVALGTILLAAELYAFTMLLLGYLQTLATLERKPVPLPIDSSTWPSVDVYIPTYNEPLEVVRTTVLAAKSIDWPADKLNVYILDDGRREQFRSFAAKAGVGYIIRPDNKHAKAGNLNHAMTKTRGEYIAIFDCDHVPTRSFLQTTVGWFLEEPKLAMLQTPHHFYSPDPFERNLGTFKNVPNEGELFYGLLQPANDIWNAVFFCGSCAVLRRTALEEVGGIAVETVTEDAHTALKMHRRGWSTAYLKLTQAAGLATESLSAHVGQRIRWARGMVQIFRIDNPLFGKGLKWQQRLCYAASMLHFLGGIPRIIFLISPLFYLLFDRHIFNSLPIVALACGLPHLAHLTITNSRVQGGVRHSFWSEVYETCLSYYIALPTTVALINPKLGKFNVTAKGGVVQDAFFESKIARPYLVLLLLNLLGTASGIWKLSQGTSESDVVAINIAWTVYNAIILTATLAVAWERKQLREAPRVTVKMPAMLRLASGATLRASTVDLSRLGGAISLPSARELPAGQRVWLSLFWGGEEVPLPAEVVSTSGKTVRLRFDALSIDEETALTEAIFSRGERLDAVDARPRDGSTAHVAGPDSLAGGPGSWQIGKSFLPQPSKGPKPAVAGSAS